MAKETIIKPIQLGRLPGREITVEVSRKGGTVTQMRTDFVGSRMETIGVTTFRDDSSPEHARSFFETFEIRE